MAGLAEAGKRSLMLTHVRELVEQDAAAFERYAPGVDYGVFCRGLGRFELDAPVVFAQTQTLHARKHLLAEPFDVVIVDEAHLIPFSGEGRYVSLIRLLRELRPGMPLIGLTATPYRLRGGWLHQGPDAWFDDIAYEVSVVELIEQGYLAPLTGKKPRAATIDTDGLRIERGDYRESDLAELVDDDALNAPDRRRDRPLRRRPARVAGVRRRRRARARPARPARGTRHRRRRRPRQHAEGRARRGGRRLPVRAAAGAGQRQLPDDRLRRSRARPAGGGEADGEHGLHVQMLGRGTRIADGKRDALVLDFAGNVQRLGPITAPRVITSNQRGEATGEAPVKVVPALRQLPGTRGAARCEHCGYEYPEPVRKIACNLDEVDPLYARPVPVEAVTYHAHYKPGRPRVAADHLPTAGPLAQRVALPVSPRLRRREGARRMVRRAAATRVPVNIDEAVRLAPALRRPPAVVVNETSGFVTAIPVWD